MYSSDARKFDSQMSQSTFFIMKAHHEAKGAAESSFLHLDSRWWWMLVQTTLGLIHQTPSHPWKYDTHQIFQKLKRLQIYQEQDEEKYVKRDISKELWVRKLQ